MWILQHDSWTLSASNKQRSSSADCSRGLCGAIRGEPFLADFDLAPLRLSPKAEALVRFLDSGGATAEQIQAFLQAFAKDWVHGSPFDPLRILRRFAADPSSAQDSSRLMALASDLLDSATPGAVELAALVRVVRALNLACEGKLEEAAAELHQIAQQLCH